MLNKSFFKYREIFLISWKTAVAYKWDVIFSMAEYFFRTILFITLFTVIYKSQQAEELAGLTLKETIWIMIGVQALVVSKTFLRKKVSDEVVNGFVVNIINKPVSYLWYVAIESLAPLFFKLSVAIVVGGVTTLWLVGPIVISGQGLLLGILLIILASILNILVDIIIGLGAFWIEKNSPIAWIYGKLKMVLGGQMFPIDFFPGFLQKIVMFSPLYLLGYYGAVRFIFKPDLELFFKVLLINAGWLLFFLLLTVFIYKKAVRRMEVNGG